MTRALPLVLCIVSLVSTGCGGAASLSSWQNGVERYVADTGGGDPNALQDVKLPDGRRGFSTLGSPNPRESTDANAVLLRHTSVNGQRRFVYLVGIVDRQAVKDIRLATLAIRDGNYDWQTSKKDPEALKAYQQFDERRWRERFPDRKTAPPEYTSFPQAADQFDVEVSDQSITATHRQPGAVWELPIS
ncbi:MAG: hypothetical protein H7Z14_18310 [Anaerolineae bacterium]|nr:hypothetical protein [Phycisphaerae bacterium]